MSYSGSVPARGSQHPAPAIKVADLRPEADDLAAERWLTMGGADVDLPTAWFVSLRRAKRLFVRRHRRPPEELVFEPQEAERVAALPQMRYHCQLWEKAVGRGHLLDCGLPDSIWGMRVVVR